MSYYSHLIFEATFSHNDITFAKAGVEIQAWSKGHFWSGNDGYVATIMQLTKSGRGPYHTYCLVSDLEDVHVRILDPSTGIKTKGEDFTGIFADEYNSERIVGKRGKSDYSGLVIRGGKFIDEDTDESA